MVFLWFSSNFYHWSPRSNLSVQSFATLIGRCTRRHHGQHPQRPQFAPRRGVTRLAQGTRENMKSWWSGWWFQHLWNILVNGNWSGFLVPIFPSSNSMIGGWPTPLKNMSSSMGRMTSHNMKWKKKMFETTNQWCLMWVCLKMLCTPKNPMVLLIIIPTYPY